MAVVDTAVAPTLAVPKVPKEPLRFFEYVRTAQDNFIAGFDEAAFRRGVSERKFLWFRSFVINDPDGIKQILVDNAKNYIKEDSFVRWFGQCWEMGWSSVKVRNGALFEG
jgi:hypothetical protein